MPIYEYRCKSCGDVHERLRRMDDADSNLRCPECDAEDVERIASAFATSGGGCGPGPTGFS